MEDTKSLILFTDGACSADSIGGCGIYFPNCEYKNISKKLLGTDELPMTNQRAELIAIYVALTSINCNEYKSIIIYSDSMYAINCITIWSDEWRKNGWKTYGGKCVKNLDLIVKILTITDVQKNIRFLHAAGHTHKTDFVSIGNREADKLAVFAKLSH